MHHERFPVNSVFCAQPQKFSHLKILLYTVVVSFFPDSRVGLVLSMVCSSPAFKQVYNCKANDVGSVRIVYASTSAC